MTVDPNKICIRCSAVKDIIQYALDEAMKEPESKERTEIIMRMNAVIEMRKKIQADDRQVTASLENKSLKIITDDSSIKK